MVFNPPASVPKLPFDPPDSIPIGDFMLDEQYGRHPLTDSKAPFTCGLTGVEYSAVEVRDRVDKLARTLANELGWDLDGGTEWDKVVGIFSVNTVGMMNTGSCTCRQKYEANASARVKIDTLTLSWAIHSLSGIVTPANAAYSSAELEYQLKSSKATALFTCLPLIGTALEAASKCGIQKNHVYILSLPKQISGDQGLAKGLKTVDQLIQEGQNLPKLADLKWEKGQGAKQTAFLCYSSGTSGLPKGVMISHRNVIANTLQAVTQERPSRDAMELSKGRIGSTGIVLGLLPQSHIYSLIVICHVCPYRGDQVIVLPKFEIHQFLQAIQRFRIQSLYLVPPVLILMAKNKAICDQYNTSSVTAVFTGAAPLGRETANDLQKQHPTWQIMQGYGLTETCTVVSWTLPDDIWFGSSGILLPSVQARIVSPAGKEIVEYDHAGELLVRSPSVALGYLDNKAASKEAFEDGWMRTGDEVMIRLSPQGTEHVWVLDRIKEMIKSKGFQVAPAELEAHLLTHPAVADSAVIPISDEAAGERPKAFVVKSQSAGQTPDDQTLIRDIQKHVELHKARYKWLKEVEFIEVIPKSPSGKILRRKLKDLHKETTRKQRPKL